MRSSLVALCILLFTSYSFSQEILTSDFYYTINSGDFKFMISEGFAGRSSVRLADIKLTEPYSSIVKDIDLKFDYTYQIDPESRQGHQFDFFAGVENLEIFMDKIVTKDKVTRSAGSISLDVFINGYCSGVKISLENNASLKGVVNLLNNDDGVEATADLQELNVGDRWSISVDQCKGPAGYESKLKAAVLKFLNNKQYVQGLVNGQINKIVKKTADHLLQKVMKTYNVNIASDLDLRFQPELIQFEEDSGGLVMSGLVSAEIESEKKSLEHLPFSLTKEEEKTTIFQSGMIVSEGYLQKLSQHIYQKGFLRTTFESQKMESLKMLQGSRFFQFFLFPDLMKYSKKANFLLDTYLNAPTQLKFAAQKKQFAWFSYDTSVKIDMKAPKSDGYVSYMYYRMPIKGKTWMTIHKDQLVIGFGKPKSQFKASWDGEYIKKYNPRRSFASRYFHRKINSTLRKQRFHFDIPPINLNSLGELKPQKIEANEKFIKLIYKFHATQQ